MTTKWIFQLIIKLGREKKYLKWIIELCVIPSKRLRASRKTHANRLTLKYWVSTTYEHRWEIYERRQKKKLFKCTWWNSWVSFCNMLWTFFYLISKYYMREKFTRRKKGGTNPKDKTNPSANLLVILIFFSILSSNIFSFYNFHH